MTQRDLPAAVWTELAGIEPARACCRAAERAGLGAAATGRARTPSIGRLAIRLEDATAVGNFDLSSAPGHCRVAYLRGAMLAQGSLSLSEAGTHLELVVAPAEKQTVAALASALGFPAGVRERRGRGVLTWKGTESIIGLLRRLGASGSTLQIETLLVGRQVHGHLNRVVNAEQANLRRAVAAARRQLDEIAIMEADGGLRHMPRHVRRVADARQRAPEATLAELATALDMSRGQVQRALESIGSAAMHREAE